MIRLSKRLNVFSILLVIGVSFSVFLSGCSGDDDIADILPDISLSVSSLDFGQVDVGSFFIETVSIRNLTNENVSVERVTSTNDAFRVGGYYTEGQLVDLEVPFTIEGDGSRTLYIGFYPDEAKEYIGKLVVESRAENSELETDLVDLQGLGSSDQESSTLEADW